MNYKKFALAAVAAGMLVSCGKTTPPAAPDWSAAVKELIAEKLYNAEIPYFLTDAFGTLSIEPKSQYGAILIDGGKLESSESIKAAADFLKEYDFVDMYEDIRGDEDYPYATEWTYPMRLKLEVEDLQGPRYVTVSLSGKLPEENEVAQEGEEAEPERYFHCEIFDPYTYTWTDSASSDLIAYSFGSKDEEGYHMDEKMYGELESYIYQSTYITDGNIYQIVDTGELYAPDIDDGLAEVAQKGYLRFYMMDVVKADLASYADDLASLEENPWTKYTYAPTVVQKGYLEHLYKLVSPSNYFTIDISFTEEDGGEAMFLVSKVDSNVPQVIKDMEPSLWASSEVSAYDFEYFEDEESGASGYSFSDLVEEGSSSSGASVFTAYGAYAGLVADQNLGAVEIVEFVAYSSAQAQGVLDIADNKVVVYADAMIAGIDFSTMSYIYYFIWGVEVSSWPTYPVELSSQFLEAVGCTNIHQFFDQDDGSFKFGQEAESAEAVASIFGALVTLYGEEAVLTAYENGIGRIQVSENMMAVVELVSQEIPATETEPASVEYGYYVTLTEIPNFPDAVIAIAEALSISKFDFVQDAETGAWYLPADQSSKVLWAEAKPNLEAVYQLLLTVPEIDLNEPEISDEDSENYGSYYVAGMLGEKMVIYQSVTVGHDASYNGYYSAQLIVCDPKEEDPAIHEIIDTIARLAGLDYEFDPVTGSYVFGDNYDVESGTTEAWVNSFVAALKEALPDLAEPVVDGPKYGTDYDIYITVSEDLVVKVSIEDWYDYCDVYAVAGAPEDFEEE